MSAAVVVWMLTVAPVLVAVASWWADLAARRATPLSVAPGSARGSGAVVLAVAIAHAASTVSRCSSAKVSIRS
jgi:hypothetical protein